MSVPSIVLSFPLGPLVALVVVVGLLGSCLRGPGPATKERGWGGTGPHHHNRWSRSGRVAPGEKPPGEPPEPGTSLGERQVPLLRFLSGCFEVVAPGLGLPGCLSADPQRGADLLPGRAFGSGGVDQEIRCSAQCLVGVSDPCEVVQRPLSAALHPVEGLDGPADFPASVGALGGAHVNGYCRPGPTAISVPASTPVSRSICDTAFLTSCRPRVGASIPGRSGIAYRLTTKKKRPRAAPTAGVVDDIRGH